MNIYKNIFNIIYMIIGLLVLANIPIHVIAQDTLAGNYPMLTIRSGIHVIK